MNRLGVSYHQGMARLACLMLLTLVVACVGGASVRPTPSPATLEASPAVALTPGIASPTGVRPTPSPATLETTPAAAAATPGIAPPAGVREEQQRPSAGASAPASTLAPAVRVGSAEFTVEPALTPAQRIQGLSGRQALAPRSGMLFIFEQEGKYTFWMKEMRFPLDLVWIGARCTVVDLTRNAPPPAPEQTIEKLPLYLPIAPARYVLEINGGEADLVGLQPGDLVGFSGGLAGLYGC
ncbi:MAG: DUF192 domain-containing protein [Chloroflexota bacterium]